MHVLPHPPSRPWRPPIASNPARAAFHMGNCCCWLLDCEFISTWSQIFTACNANGISLAFFYIFAVVLYPGHIEISYRAAIPDYCQLLLPESEKFPGNLSKSNLTQLIHVLNEKKCCCTFLGYALVDYLCLAVALHTDIRCWLLLFLYFCCLENGT